MAMIRSSSALRNNYNEISEFCKTQHEPVFITKNGDGDLVVLSNAEYERMQARAELYGLLNEGLLAMNEGNARPAEEVFSDLEARFGVGEV
jgi:prevent-host-death family protein